MSFLLPSCEEIPPEALPPSETLSSPKSDMPASKPFISKGSIEQSSNCEFLPKIYHLLSFWKSLSSTKLTYTQTFSAQIYALTLVSMRNVSENTLPFVSQSINKHSKTSFEKNCFSAWASTLNMGLINKVDMVCLSPVGYGV